MYNYQELFNNFKQAIVVTDLDGIVIYVNPTFERNMGYLKNEVIGKSNTIFYLNEAEAGEITKTIKEIGKIDNYLTRVKSKYNFIRFIEINAWKLGDNDVIVRVSKYLEQTEILHSVIKITENILGPV